MYFVTLLKLCAYKFPFIVFCLNFVYDLETRIFYNKQSDSSTSLLFVALKPKCMLRLLWDQINITKQVQSKKKKHNYNKQNHKTTDVLTIPKWDA